MDLYLKDKVAIVTGGGRGIGRMICIILAQEGAKVTVNDYFADRAKAVADEIKASGGQAIAVQADVTKFDQVEAMVKETVDTWGTVHILGNNVGLPPEPLGERGSPYFAGQNRSAFDSPINLNVWGCINCCKAVINHMVTQNYGKIVSIISDAGRVGEPREAVYSGAKAFIVAFSKTLAKENARFCINVNCVSPSLTAKEDKPGPERLELEKQYYEFYPLAKGRQRLGRPSDLANAFVFLVSDRAEWITGQVLSVNGGYCMTD